MSINHYYSMDLPETTLWWTQQQQQQHQQQHQPILVEPIQNPSSTSGPPIHPSWPLQHQPTWFNSPSHYPTTRFNLNNHNDDELEQEEDEEEEEKENDDDNNNNNNDQTTTTQQGGGEENEKEPMFEKPLTPSDVGKLNRLVIPKQHAEKYFPLGSGGDSGECKGLLLSFEDESGKCWRFRYSYWNSSQSYVLTKGWSRYVKDKRLDAGDVVLFQRHRADSHRLFINWRRRNSSGTTPAHVSRVGGHGKSSDGNSSNSNNKNEVGGGVGMGWTRGFYSAHPYPTHHHHHSLPYQHDCLHAGRGSQVQNQRTRSVGNSSSSSSSSRVLRLFGVNMECQPEHDSGPSTPACSYNSNNMPSTQDTDTHNFYHHHQTSPQSSNPHPHMVRHQPYHY